MPDSRARDSDWLAAALSAAIPLCVAAGLIDAALTPQWDDSGDWVWGLLVLMPLEFVRTLVFSILGDAFSDYQNPRHAVHTFLLSLLILAALGIGAGLYVAGPHDFFEFLSDVDHLAVIALTASILVADGVIALYFFRGNPRCQGARIQAAADDIVAWMQLLLYPAPLILAALYGLLIWARREGYGVPDWIPPPSLDLLRAAAMIYAAGYFLGKAVILAHVRTGGFNRSGRRLFAGSWFIWLTSRDAEDRNKSRREEAAKQSSRKSVLQREDEPAPGRQSAN